MTTATEKLTTHGTQTIHERVGPILAASLTETSWAAAIAMAGSNMDSDALLAYERTPEFRFYLLAKVEWEQTKESYLRGPRTAAAVKAELRAWEYAQTLLELARRTPEHLAAFGY